MRRVLLAIIALTMGLGLAGVTAIYFPQQQSAVSLRGLSSAEMAGLGITFAEPPPPAGQALGRALLSASVRRSDLPAPLQPMPEVTVDAAVAQAFALSLLAPGGTVLDTRLLLAKQVHPLLPGADCNGNSMVCAPLVSRGLSAWWVVVVRGRDRSGLERRLLYLMDPQERGAFAVELPG